LARVCLDDRPPGRARARRHRDDRLETRDRRYEPDAHPENIPRDVASVINTHLHFDHCGGNRLFPGVPIHVQARELADARSLDDYTIREWVDFDGATYVEHEGEVELLPGIRLLPAPGHTDGIVAVGAVLTQRGLQPSPADEAAGEDEDCFVDVVAAAVRMSSRRPAGWSPRSPAPIGGARQCATRRAATRATSPRHPPLWPELEILANAPVSCP
jgi:hypothetical protein